MLFDVNSDVESLYIHWPFCPYKCSFCPFVAFAGQDHYAKEYCDALILEIEEFVIKVGKKLKIKTIYLGGGTPSSWPIELLLDTSGKLRELFNLNELKEFTIEVNPGTVNIEKLEAWQKIGIDRLSIGVQSLNDSALKALNRHQKYSDVIWLLNNANLRFKSLSIDMIVGLPSVSEGDWKKFVIEIGNWPIKHISVYFLSIHENTPLSYQLSKNRVELPCDDSVVDLYYWTIESLKSFGFFQYEISSFAKPGYESLHNQVYWDRKPFKAFGVGACSFDGISRFQNEMKLIEYVKKSNEKIESYSSNEKLSNQEIRLEKIMLGLRRSSGVEMKDMFFAIDDLERIEIIKKRIEEFENKGFIKIKDNKVILNSSSFAIENEVAVALSK